MRFLGLARLVLLIGSVVIGVGVGNSVLASHESTNTLAFSTTTDSLTPNAVGQGVIAFHGGAEPHSRWTVSFDFSDMEASTDYVVVDQGRFGEDDEPAATEFTVLCGFRTDEAGSGGCWDYLFGLRRANVVQLRRDGVNGPIEMQASRAEEGPGAITSVPNFFSPDPPVTTTPAPAATPASE